MDGVLPKSRLRDSWLNEHASGTGSATAYASKEHGTLPVQFDGGDQSLFIVPFLSFVSSCSRGLDFPVPLCPCFYFENSPVSAVPRCCNTCVTTTRRGRNRTTQIEWNADTRQWVSRTVARSHHTRKSDIQKSFGSVNTLDWEIAIVRIWQNYTETAVLGKKPTIFRNHPSWDASFLLTALQVQRVSQSLENKDTGRRQPEQGGVSLNQGKQTH